MGDMFRSEQMALCQMFMQPEAAYASIAELGEIGCVQFRDLNSNIMSFQRKFVNEVRRCDELERRVRYIENELKKDAINMPEIHLHDEPSPPNPREIIDLEAHLELIENEIRELSQNGVNLKQNYLGMSELKNVLENTEGFFSATEAINLDINRYRNPSENISALGQRGQLGFVAGIINLERFFAFERMLWRISRGNIFLKRSDLSDASIDPETGRAVLKTVFVAFFQGDQLKNRIKKVCDGFHASVYPCPSAHTEREDMIKEVRLRIQDLQMVLNQTADHRSRVLFSAAKNMSKWSIMVKKMKAIYHTLNLFNVDLSNKCLIGEGWVPKSDLPKVQRALAQGSTKVESTIPSFLNVIDTTEQPPTYTRTNKFTRGFQNLIEAYGLSTYREVNPGLYTCITFPFLFSLMFGDAGHGAILLLFGAWMTIWEKKLSERKGEIWSMFFGGRYIILLMGLFSIYSGFIYNDVFSKSMNIFGSKWRVRYNTSTVLTNPFLQMAPDYSTIGVYPLGLDPIWQLGENKIILQNSFKMKLSIIIGVIHMAFGVCMSLVNHIHFKKYSGIILEFIPQMLFLLLLFGYMVFMMFFKWIRYSAKEAPPLSPGCAPSILVLFINMMLFKSEVPQAGCKEFMFEAQDQMQTIFFAVAVICIPWMLFGRPFYVMFQRRGQQQQISSHTNGVNTTSHENGRVVSGPDSASTQVSVPSNQDGGGHGDDEPISEVFILQAIHTIEYVLSTISHTASYLRLWALSLAHAQLSEVLWKMVLHTIFVVIPGYYGAIAIWIVFWLWALLTLFILVLLEGLSAFLHTLRLHWVEFMSKFYGGLGYAFTPYSFRAIIDSEEEE